MIFARRRWDRAFGDNDEVNHDLRATIVIEAHHAGFRRVAHDAALAFTGSGTTNYRDAHGL
jgi:hypothetical protein